MCPSCPFKGASFSTSTHHMTQYLIIKVSSDFVQLYCKRYIFNMKLPLRLIQGTPNSWVAMSALHLTMLRTILPLLVAVSACDWSIFGLNFSGLDERTGARPLYHTLFAFEKYGGPSPGKNDAKTLPFREFQVVPTGWGEAGRGEYAKRDTKGFPKLIVRINMVVSNMMHKSLL